MKNFTGKVIAVGCVIAGLLALLTFWNPEHEVLAEVEHEQESRIIPLSPEQIEATQLSLQPVQGRSLQLKTSFPATIVFNTDRFAHVVTDVAGIAREVRKNLGDQVEAGEILAILESRDIAEAKADYLATVRYEQLAQITLTREKGLNQKKVSAEADVLIAQHDSDKATIQRQLAEQKLQALGLSLEAIQNLPRARATDLRLYEVYAPFDGTIVQRDIAPGELIPAGSTPYAIADLTTVWVDIGIHSKDIESIQVGQNLSVINRVSGQQGEARIIYISPVIDSETRAARVIAELENPQKSWRPGTFVTAEAITQTVNAKITVPKDALQRIDGTDVLFIQVNDGIETRCVEVGVSDSHYIEILSGLEVGDSCATQNTFVLKSEVLKGNGEE